MVELKKEHWMGHEDLCPYCKVHVDCVSGGDERPKVGDLSVCIYCAGFMQFDENLILQALSDEAFEKLPDYAKDDLTKMKKTVLAMQSLRGVLGTK